MTERDRNNSLVVAIDIGTTYSGYAFSKRYTFKTDPLNIRVNLSWYSGSGRRLLTSKTPTCILLNSDKEFVSFGYEAENQYADLVMNKQQQDYYYFPRFMTSLHNDKNLSNIMMIEDIIGKPVLAIDVIAHLIRALADHAMTAMEAQGTRVNTNDKRIQWVLTVPAIWTDNSENFMTDCAEKAGIQQDHLLLIKQQEAALIYCHHLPLNKVGDAELSGEETKCMVVDLGGTTVDISVFGKLVKGGEKELGRITRGDCGGTSVDNGFIQLFENILGKHLLNTMEREHFKDYLDLLTGWEASKRTFKADDEISINVPNQTLDSLCKRHLQKDFSTVLESTYANSISIKFNKMRIDRDLSKSIFDNTIKRILKLLQELFTVFDFQTEELIFLVGGFSECKLIQLTIKDAFPMKTILVPEPTDLATLKGAVLYGHNNEKCYELQTNISFVPFDEDIIDNFDFTKRSPPPLFTEDSEGIFSPGISKTAKETCETVLIGFEMTTTDNILMHGDISMACFSHTVNAAKMKKNIERNKCHWVDKVTVEALRLSQVYELLQAFKENNYTEITKFYYRLQHDHTLNTQNEPLEIPVYIHRCQLKNKWIGAVQNAITSINEATPGINLHETEDINRSHILIGVHESIGPTVACTMYGSIKESPREYKPFIHLGSKWDVNQMEGTSIHELMHALGFHHEMQRLDAEMYLDVDKNADHNYDKKVYKI